MEIPSRYLIVKTSSLGDIIQSFGALSWLQTKEPGAKIDWLVEKRFASIVEAHPLVHRTIAFDLKGKQDLWHSIRQLRQERYDAIFDLQGNCKSGALTLLARGKKVGFSLKSVREWPNILATHHRFEVSRSSNIRLQYISLLAQYFNSSAQIDHVEGVRFKVQDEGTEFLKDLFSDLKLQARPRIMVCPGSKWVNKQLPFETLLEVLQKIHQELKSGFLLIWGNDEERVFCERLQKELSYCSVISGQMPLPIWQNAMVESDLVIAVDSAALHLCATTSTPSFSIFGPTSPSIFKPFGDDHFSFQGKCPYSVTFDKQCPRLRSCPTGACIRQASAEEISRAFFSWWK